MTDPVLLICGAAFNAEERERLEKAHAAIFVSKASETEALPEAVRAGIRALAFKGHGAMTGAVMDRFPALGLIANYGVGYDSIDVAAATERGVKVTNTPDVLNDDVADLAIALMLSQSRRIPFGENWVRSGQWAEKGEMALNRKASGSKAGIVGLGRIGREIANRLAAFKMDIHYHSRSEKQTPGWTYHADVVSASPARSTICSWRWSAGPETKRTTSHAEAIMALGPARRADQHLARHAPSTRPRCSTRWRAAPSPGPALTCILNEPNIDPRFLALENVALQPHQGSGTVETRRAMAELQLDNIRRVPRREGDLPTPVN